MKMIKLCIMKIYKIENQITIYKNMIQATDEQLIYNHEWLQCTLKTDQVPSLDNRTWKTIPVPHNILKQAYLSHRIQKRFTVNFTQLWTPKMCLESLLCYNQSKATSFIDHRIPPCPPVSFPGWNASLLQAQYTLVYTWVVRGAVKVIIKIVFPKNIIP